MPTISKNQIDKLGRRIRDGETSAGDQEIFQELSLEWYALALEVAQIIHQVVTVENLGVAFRAKNFGTIQSKLRRQQTLQLSYMRDLVGCRIVVKRSRRDQHIATSEIVTAFSDYKPKVVNRIEDPRVGYRAVHVALTMDDARAEVQIRTKLQHAWAEAMERLGDLAGRDLRYDDNFAFEELDAHARQMAILLRNSLLNLAELIDEYEITEARISDMDQISQEESSILMLARVRLMLALNREIKVLVESHNQQFELLSEVLQ